MTQEADPKLDALRGVYERGVLGLDDLSAVSVDADAAFIALVSYIEGREREKWEAALTRWEAARETQEFPPEIWAVFNSIPEMEQVEWDISAEVVELVYGYTLRALLQHEEEGRP